MRAHHLIPAIQCLRKLPRLSAMCKTVGYDVNNPANGLSLPTCGQQALNSYASRQGGMAQYSELSPEDKTNAAFALMQGLNRQWHVGHHDWSMDFDTDNIAHLDNYDKLVELQLQGLQTNVLRDGESICEPDDGTESGSALIEELNAISQDIASKVLAWQLYFVSAMSMRFASKYRG